MPAVIEVDDHTYRSLEFAARMSKSTAGEVVARLVHQASMPGPGATATGDVSSGITVYADYGGRRTHGNYDRITSRIDITSGPLAGRSFKSPTGAARAVVAHFNPRVNPNRNGWWFWSLDDGSGQFLQSMRHTR